MLVIPLTNASIIGLYSFSGEPDGVSVNNAPSVRRGSRIPRIFFYREA